MVALLMMGLGAQAPESTGVFKTDYFSYGRLEMRLPVSSAVDTTRSTDYIWYRIRSEAWSCDLNLLLGFRLPGGGFTGRRDVILAGRERRELAGTRGLASWGTYKDREGRWFDFTSGKLFGKDVFLRIWYERASDQDTGAINQVLNTLKASSK